MVYSLHFFHKNKENLPAETLTEISCLTGADAAKMGACVDTCGRRQLRQEQA